MASTRTALQRNGFLAFTRTSRAAALRKRREPAIEPAPPPAPDPSDAIHFFGPTTEQR